MVKTVSPGLQKKNLCIFLVGFMIDPSAQALGTSFKILEISGEEFLTSGLERVNFGDRSRHPVCLCE